MYEVVWDTTGFNNKADWPADGSQPFVLSQGDPTGLGQHADYVFGCVHSAPLPSTQTHLPLLVEGEFKGRTG
jgi:hypothetical protein